MKPYFNKQDLFKAVRSTVQFSADTIEPIKQYLATHRWQKRAFVAFGLLVLWLISTYLFFRRFPNNYREPNFFGEEGYIWAYGIIHHGFWHAFFTTFNGYYIWGLYILEKIAFLINDLFYGGQFANLPRSLSLVSYGFLGLMAVLPLALLRRTIKLPVLLLAIPLIIYVPLLGWDYGIIGDIGNYKFVFVYIAFLVLIYRHSLPKGSRKFYIVDACLLLCAYTNVTIYLMLPFALIRYLPDVWGSNFLHKAWMLLRSDRSLQSLAILCLLLLPQIYIVKHDGIPVMPGYLDEPYDSKRTAEVFIGRSFLYGFTFPFYKHLNDLTVSIVAIAVLGLGWFAKPYRKFIFLGGISIFLATFLFILKRPGVSTLYHGYTDPGPDQFFFTQNWIFGLLTLVIIVELILKLKKAYYRIGIYALLAIIFCFYYAPQSGSFGKNDFEAKTVGNIYAEGKEACRSSDQSFDLAIYPSGDLKFKDVSRKMLCTPVVLNYQAPIVSLGLTPNGNRYIQLSTKQTFTQRFISKRSNLDGLVIYFSTFATKIKSPYTLKLYDASCRRLITSARIHTHSLIDNDFSNVLFSPLTSSSNKMYCFSIVADSSPYSPLAIQLSKQGAYPNGRTTVLGKPTNQSVVFALHYR